METKKPLKRSVEIVEFSKDHHFALLLIWKIREGVKKEVDTVRISKYAIHFYDIDLIHHFAEEEAILFSTLASDNTLKIKAEDDHKIIKELVAALRGNLDDKIILTNFADTLDKHIRFEEREMFNHIQENITEQELAQIATSAKPRVHESDDMWNDKFWEIKR